MSIQLKVLPASRGDSLLITYNSNSTITNILIDGGIGRECYAKLKQEILNISNTNHHIDLLVVTHIDEDHISGIIKLFQDSSIKKSLFKDVWFNSGKLILNSNLHSNRELTLSKSNDLHMSVNQGITLESELLSNNCWKEEIIKVGYKTVLNGAEITVLSPDDLALRNLSKKWEIESNKSREMSSKTNDHHLDMDTLLNNNYKEDTSVSNGSSISFIFSMSNIKVLLLGDAHTSTIVNSLRELGYSETNRLSVDVVKVSHHGSKHNTSEELLRLIDCNKFVISTNGSLHGLPDKECLSRILNSIDGEVHFYFNYPKIGSFFTENELSRFQLSCHYLNENNYTLILEE